MITATEDPRQSDLFTDAAASSLGLGAPIGEQAGVDEVGIGPLAGPVVAAAVMLDADHGIDGLNDSKQLTDKRRQALAEQIRARAIAFGVGWASVADIERLNVLRASHLAMQRAVRRMAVEPKLLLVDGNKTPHMPMPCISIIQGDGRIEQISAASIVAKVARDAAMNRLDQHFPGYGFARHKGYPTAAHLSALRTHGVSPVHRRSYAPVRALLAEGQGGVRQSDLEPVRAQA